MEKRKFDKKWCVSKWFMVGSSVGNYNLERTKKCYTITKVMCKWDTVILDEIIRFVKACYDYNTYEKQIETAGTFEKDDFTYVVQPMFKDTLIPPMEVSSFCWTNRNMKIHISKFRTVSHPKSSSHRTVSTFLNGDMLLLALISGTIFFNQSDRNLPYRTCRSLSYH